MALNKTEIANLALGRCGSTFVLTDLATNDSIQAKVIRRHFQTALETFLTAHEWGFATKSLALSLLDDDQDAQEGWLYSYSYPADCLLLRQISPYYAGTNLHATWNQLEKDKFKFVERYSASGPVIYADVKDAHALYTVKIADTFNFPTHFGRGLSAQLALDIGPQLVTNNWAKVEAALLKRCRNDISLAIADDIARTPLKEDSPSPFLRARL